MRLISAVVLALACVATHGCDQDSPTAPSPAMSDLTGTWTGTGTYPNAPFRFVFMQSGTTLRGEYSDGLDRSLSVGGTYTFPTFTVDVDFGDGHLHFAETSRESGAGPDEHGIHFDVETHEARLD